MGFGDSINLGLEDAIQAVKSAAGFVSLKDRTIGESDLPWQSGTSTISSKFFQSISIDSSRWDKLFPYRLLVIDAKNNRVIQNSKGALAVPNVSVSVGTGSALITFDASNSSSWIFTLPITPQQLTIQDQYAIQTSMTLRGVLEEHSGVRLKMINAQGTMGVWAQRSNVTTPSGTPGILQSVFGGTLNALGDVLGQVSKIVNTATNNHPANKPVSLLPETSKFGETSTGYYQALKLQQFLEQYSEAKKDPNNATWRLVFDIPKQNQSFIVTPMMYDWLQNVSKPMEIQYRFQLKAWRRVNLGVNPNTQELSNQPLTPGALQRILNTFNQCQQLLSASLNLIGAVRSDVQAPLNALKQTVLLIKGLIGVINTAADLPNQIASDYRSAISSFINTFLSTILGSVSDPKMIAAAKSIAAALQQFEGLSLDAVSNKQSANSNGQISSAASQSGGASSRLGSAGVQQGNSSGQLGSAAAISLSLNSINNIFSKPEAYFVLLDKVPLNSLSLTNEQQSVVQGILEDASQTTVAQLKEFRNTIQQLAIQLSNNFGAGSEEYNRIYNLPPPTPRIQPMTLDEYDLLDSLYNVMAGYDVLTATTTLDDQAIENNMQYVAGLADIAGITFTTPNSKILVPVPFGLTIESISARYLGDPQRWLEIVTLNNLRDPYIDENGFQLSLLSNANGRQVTVNSNVNLYVGQRVVLKSSTQTPAARIILDIDRLSDTSFLLTLDGLPNLDNFTIADSAYVQAYLPGTVNSQQKIFVPSDSPVPDDSSIVPPPGTSNDPLTGLSKVDWLLQDNGDLAINNYGDFRYSSGITNIIQALRIKFGTQAGTVLLHPNFGLNIKVGTISSELQIQELFNSINNMITQDPRFAGVSKLQINLNGPILGISLAVSLPGQIGVFPVSFALTV